MLKAVKVRNGQTCDGYGRPLMFDMVALRKQWERADAHKAKRTGDVRAVAEIATAHSPKPFLPA